jgi:hypothetical protein
MVNEPVKFLSPQRQSAPKAFATRTHRAANRSKRFSTAVPDPIRTLPHLTPSSQLMESPANPGRFNSGLRHRPVRRGRTSASRCARSGPDYHTYRRRRLPEDSYLTLELVAKPWTNHMSGVSRPKKSATGLDRPEGGRTAWSENQGLSGCVARTISSNSSRLSAPIRALCVSGLGLC